MPTRVEETQRMQVTEDELRKSEDDTQKLTDQYMHKVDDVVKKKEQELWKCDLNFTLLPTATVNLAHLPIISLASSTDLSPL